jgi:hypothetical protein
MRRFSRCGKTPRCGRRKNLLAYHTAFPAPFQGKHAAVSADFLLFSLSVFSRQLAFSGIFLTQKHEKPGGNGAFSVPARLDTTNSVSPS